MGCSRNADPFPENSVVRIPWRFPLSSGHLIAEDSSTFLCIRQRYIHSRSFLLFPQFCCRSKPDRSLEKKRGEEARSALYAARSSVLSSLIELRVTAYDSTHSYIFSYFGAQGDPHKTFEEFFTRTIIIILFHWVEFHRTVNRQICSSCF